MPYQLWFITQMQRLQNKFGINWTNSIAYKLYHLNLDFNQLTSEELKFWKTFKTREHFGVAIWKPNTPTRLLRVHLHLLHNHGRSPSPSATTSSTTTTAASTTGSRSSKPGTRTKSLQTGQTSRVEKQTKRTDRTGSALRIKEIHQGNNKNLLAGHCKEKRGWPFLTCFSQHSSSYP